MTLSIGLSFEYHMIRDVLFNRHKRIKQGSYVDFEKSAYSKFPPFWLNKVFFGVESNKRPANLKKFLCALNMIQIKNQLSHI